MNPEEFGFGLKCKELFALARRELALLLTPLLLRFFSPLPPLSTLGLPCGLPFPPRFSPLSLSPAGFGVLEESRIVDESAVEWDVPEFGLSSFGGDPELPNILFSRPPWEEKLLLLFPATLLTLAVVSREETRGCGGGKVDCD